MSDEPNFEGHPSRECREHRTVGSHRAWCYDCGEWCYPRLEAACIGCRAPWVDAELNAVAAELRTHDLNALAERLEGLRL